MKFSYTPRFLGDYESVEYDPLLWVSFTSPTTERGAAVLGMIDSGAAEILLHTGIGEAMGIDITSGEKVRFSGISGTIEGYKHPVRMQVRGDKKAHEVTVAFAPIEGMDALFGQRGFFEHYKVVFEKYKNQFEIVAKPRARST
jgi:hypothetical protein